MVASVATVVAALILFVFFLTISFGCNGCNVELFLFFVVADARCNEPVAPGAGATRCVDGPHGHIVVVIFGHGGIEGRIPSDWQLAIPSNLHDLFLFLHAHCWGKAGINEDALRSWRDYSTS